MTVDPPLYSPAVRRTGIATAAAVVALLVAYAVTLAVGLLSLASPDDAIGGATLALLEGLILLLAPAMVVLMGAAHAWAPSHAKAFTLLALVFMGAMATVTSGVHAVILVVGSDPAFVADPLAPSLTAFRWPSVVYALDVLAWDLFFPLAMVSAAAAFAGGRLERAVRAAMLASGALAPADMSVRNVGIVGYVGGFLVVSGLLGVLFHRTAAHRPG